MWIRKYPNPELRKNYILPTLLVYSVFILLYSTNTLPPIPLSLQKIGIYHHVNPQNGAYELSQQTPLWKVWNNGDQEFHARAGDKVFVFTRVFAPQNFRDKIYLRWEKQDASGSWKTSDRIPLKIVGGRGLGFRGYAYKANYSPGHWRVRVETGHESEIGRVTFEVFNDSTSDPRDWVLTYE